MDGNRFISRKTPAHDSIHLPFDDSDSAGTMRRETASYHDASRNDIHFFSRPRYSLPISYSQMLCSKWCSNMPFLQWWSLPGGSCMETMIVECITYCFLCDNCTRRLQEWPLALLTVFPTAWLEMLQGAPVWGPFMMESYSFHLWIMVPTPPTPYRSLQQFPNPLVTSAIAM